MKPMLADVGIGILFAPLPAMIALLISVTLIEAFVTNRRLAGGFLSAANGLFWANAASTIIGYPLGWVFWWIVIALVPRGHWGVERVGLDCAIMGMSPILQLGWLSVIPSMRGEEALGFIIAATILLVPSFYVSVWIERRICAWVWGSGSSELPSVGTAVRKANVASYLFLFTLLVCYAIYAAVSGQVK
jgi:hypothetical protein